MTDMKWIECSSNGKLMRAVGCHEVSQKWDVNLQSTHSNEQIVARYLMKRFRVIFNMCHPCWGRVRAVGCHQESRGS